MRTRCPTSRVIHAGYVVGHQFLHGFDLLVRNRRARGTRTHNTHHALNLSDLRDSLRGLTRMKKCVAGKQRHLNPLAPIAPAVDFLHQRQIRVDAAAAYLCGHHLFVPGARVGYEPFLWEQGLRRVAAADWKLSA